MTAMNTEDYVSYPIAKQLKAAGFDEPCDCYWYKVYTDSDEMEMRQGKTMDYNNDGWFVPHCSAPTLWQAQKWLRSKGIEVYVLLAAENDRYEWSIYDRNVRDNLDSSRVDDYKTYEQALSAGIARALELIKGGE